MSPAADSRKHTYKVRIYNQTYSIASSASEAEFQQIADYVDHLMHTIASRSGSADSTRAAVMAAMHLADKLRQMEQRMNALQTEQNQTLAQVEEQTSYLEQLLRETLEMDHLLVADSKAASASPPIAEPDPEPSAERAAHLPDFPNAPLRISPTTDPAEADSLTEQLPAVPRSRARRERDASMPTLFPMADPEN